MFLPVGVSGLLEALETAGFAAYAVGGCVRDSLLGRVPQDWDIATSARPEEVLARFPHAIPTGIAHGTVTVVWEGEPFEVTTFRAESAYTDHRHPDQVRFVPDLEADLARRDFTVNAMACRRDGQVIDRFGGWEDLKNGIIRCVGDPGERFREDALRILRALRFAACYGFRLEEKTSAAVLESRELLCYVAAERIWAEFSRLLCGIDAGRVLREFPQVIFAILPELFPMEGFLQHNPHHDRDVWEHTCAAVEASSPELAVRLAMLLHDCGKPGCFTLDGEGTGHFYGHAQKSLELAGAVLRRLRVPRLLGERVLLLIHLHDRPVFPEERWVKRQLGRWGEEVFFQWLAVKEADTLAQALAFQPPRLANLREVEAAAQAVLREGQCFSLKQLAVTGCDLLQLGIPQGPQVGALLEQLVQAVIDGQVENQKETLLAYVAFLSTSTGEEPGKGGNPWPNM